MSKKHKNVCCVLNYIENVLILVSTVSISGFASLNVIPVGIANFAVGLIICVITPGIKTISQ